MPKRRSKRRHVTLPPAAPRPAPRAALSTKTKEIRAAHASARRRAAADAGDREIKAKHAEMIERRSAHNYEHYPFRPVTRHLLLTGVLSHLKGKDLAACECVGGYFREKHWAHAPDEEGRPGLVEQAVRSTLWTRHEGLKLSEVRRPGEAAAAALRRVALLLMYFRLPPLPLVFSCL